MISNFVLAVSVMLAVGVLGLVSSLVADRLRLRRNGLGPPSLVVYDGEIRSGVRRGSARIGIGQP